MATINSLAIEYSKYLRLNKNNPRAVSEIRKKIDQLTYTRSGEKIKQEDKDKIIEEIKNELTRVKKTPDGLSFALESEDSSSLIKLIKKLQEEKTKG